MDLFKKYAVTSVMTVSAVFFIVTMVMADSDSKALKNALEEWQVPARAAQRKNPDPQTNPIPLGKAVYVRECLSCHGVAGKGDGLAAKSLGRVPTDLSNPQVLRQTDGTLFWKITEGHRPMPTFKLHLSEDETWHVINYIRTFVYRDTVEKKKLS